MCVKPFVPAQDQKIFILLNSMEINNLGIEVMFQINFTPTELIFHGVPADRIVQVVDRR